MSIHLQLIDIKTVNVKENITHKKQTFISVLLQKTKPSLVFYYKKQTFISVLLQKTNPH